MKAVIKCKDKKERTYTLF